MDTNINTVLKNIALKLNIDENILIDIIKTKISDSELLEPINDKDKLEKINELLKIDSQFTQFEKDNIKEESTKENFNKLKQNLGKLQVLVLIKKLKKTKDCSEVLNVLLGILNNKFENVNNILISDLVQSGGGNNYYNKYLKYKLKYLELIKLHK